MMFRRLHILIAAVATLLLSLVAIAVATPDTAEASDPLWFKSTKGNWAVTSGDAAAEIGRVRARGVPKTHIRYSVQGADGFSIGRRSGKVSYDGTPISTSSVSLTVTARDAKGRADSASVNLRVSVSQQANVQTQKVTPPPTPTPTCTVGLVLDVGERCVLPEGRRGMAGVEIQIEGTSSKACLVTRNGGHWCVSSGFFALNGLGIGKQQGKWTITAVP